MENIIDILHGGDYHTKNKEKNNYASTELLLHNKVETLIEKQIPIYVFAGDMFDDGNKGTINDSERKLVYRHIAEVLNIPTLKEFVFMGGNHDFLFNKKQIDSNMSNNTFDTLVKFIETLAPELHSKVTYLKYQKPYQSKHNSNLYWIPYSLEDGMSNGNNFDWNSFEQIKLNNPNATGITIYHDILVDYVEETKLPVRKDKLEKLSKFEDFKTNIILAADIHKNYTKKNFLDEKFLNKIFIYPGSSNQVNYGEGTYIKIRKKSMVFHADEKCVKLHNIDLSDGGKILNTNDIILPCYVSYITIDINTNTSVDNFLEEIETLLNTCKFGIISTEIKLKLSASYIKHEIEIFKLIENICSVKNTLYSIATTYDKFLLDTGNLTSDLELEQIENSEENQNDINFDINDLKLTSEKLNMLFHKVLNNHTTTLYKEIGDEELINDIIDNVKSLFSEQIEFSLSAVPNYKIDLESVECNVFMNLGKNKIKLDIPGLTKINGTNGIGKTTLFNMIRFIITGLVLEGLKAGNKKQNALLVFNDKLINVDVISQRLMASINNTQIAITRTTARKWKTSATDEIKSSLNWKSFIAEVTSSVKLDVMTKDGQKTYTGEEAEGLISKWFGDLTNTILILNHHKILSMLNLSSDKLQKLVLDYIGVDYLALLKENLPVIKNQYNLVKPSIALDVLKLQYIEKNKIKNEGKSKLLNLKEQIKISTEDSETFQTNIENKNKELLKLGDIPESIKSNQNDIDVQNKLKEEFIEKEKLELPLFEDIEPSRPDLAQTENKKQQLIDANELLQSKISEIKPKYNINKNEVLVEIRKNKELYPKQISDLYINKSESVVIEINENKNNLTNAWDFINTEISKTHKLISDKKLEKTTLISDLKLNKTKFSDRNTVIDEEISSGVCEKCLRAFDEANFENHKIKLQNEKDENLKKIELLTSDILKENENFNKIENLLTTYNDYITNITKQNYTYFETIENFQFQAEIINIANLSKENVCLNYLNNQLEKNSYEFVLESLTTKIIEDYKIFDDFIPKIKLIEKNISNLDLLIENLLLEKFDEIENKSQKIIDLQLIFVEIENNQKIIDTNKLEIDELTKTINTSNSDYNTLLSNYNTKFTEHNTKVTKINADNVLIDEYNKSINIINSKILDLKTVALNLEISLPVYTSLTNQIVTLKEQKAEHDTTHKSIETEFNELDKALVTVDNELLNIENDLNAWKEYRKNKFIYDLYDKLINNDFPDIIFEYYRTYLNNTLNVLLQDLNFKLFWDNVGDLYMIEFGNGLQTYRPVQLTSGMQTVFLGLSLIYAIHLLNVKNDISHIFIDELSGALNTGKELTEKVDIINFQEQFVTLINKFSKKKIFIIDHNIDNMFETITYEVVKDTETNTAKFITV